MLTHILPQHTIALLVVQPFVGSMWSFGAALTTTAYHRLNANKGAHSAAECVCIRPALHLTRVSPAPLIWGTQHEDWVGLVANAKYATLTIKKKYTFGGVMFCRFNLCKFLRIFSPLLAAHNGIFLARHVEEEERMKLWLATPLLSESQASEQR